MQLPKSNDYLSDISEVADISSKKSQYQYFIKISDISSYGCKQYGKPLKNSKL